MLVSPAFATVLAMDDKRGPTLETHEWANGLRASLQAEIDAVFKERITSSQDAERVVRLHQQLTQVNRLIAAFERGI